MSMTCQQFRRSPNLFGDRGACGVWPTKRFSERIAKVLRGFYIKVAHKPIRTISNILKKTIKDPLSFGTRFAFFFLIVLLNIEDVLVLKILKSLNYFL